jgi:hypothetical protein
LKENAEEIAMKIGRDSLIQGKFNVERLLSVAGPPGNTWAHYFKEEALALIEEKSIQHAGSHGRFVDIVQDVINLLPVHWISEQIVS